MLAICIESSHTRGMGHLFHSLLYVDYLKKNNIQYVYLINHDDASEKILAQNDIRFINVDFDDYYSDWEGRIIDEYGISLWFNDKFCSSYLMGKHIKDKGTAFFVLDDVGEGEEFATAAFSGMLYPTKKSYRCKNIYKGIEYVVLNPEIDKYKRLRKEVKRIIVTLGGSDTYGATVEVIKALKQLEACYKIDVLVGPGFIFWDELNNVLDDRYRLLQNVPSLIQLFCEYDIAITGGGVTCCEAMASGLPCLVIANEDHEVNTAKFYEKLGGCIYIGKHGEWDRKKIKEISNIDIESMSNKGMELFDTNAVERIFQKVLKYEKGDL